MNKRALVETIIAQLARELESCAHSARSAHAEATHEQNKAENKYDTRALEASYLARGQSFQAAEIEEALRRFGSLDTRTFGPSDAINIGALVQVEVEGRPIYYFIGPGAGGMDVLHEKKLVTVITPETPIVRQLLGRKSGDRFSFGSARARVEYVIRTVW